ncbi:hypothetical protein BG015_004009 [Linnemannia schmuckeri]|uniref:Uncharacterized protein n=1 Tax=Linnemannia schmuckeri TaxID=64567 RepID=A0A9P5RFA4_9FUNG|nr:hypothetical protein BG015_004009 [Linnemannia schmuckeri]
MVAASTRQNLIIAGSAVIGLTTIGAVAYLLIQDDRRTKHLRLIKTTQKQLSSSLTKIESSLQSLIDEDVRLAQVRTKTLRQHPIYPSDPHVHLPSLGLINDQDKKELGEDIQETEEELIRERSSELGFAKDPAKVRQGYKKLDFLVQSINERLLRLLEGLDAVSPRELTDMGDGFGGIALANGPEVQAFEKVRKRKRADIARIQKLMGQMDKLAGSFKDRLVAVEIYEKKAAEAAAEAKEQAALAAAKEAEEKRAKEEQEHKEQEVNGHVAPAVAALVQENVSFAEIAKHNIPEPEILAPTEDLEKMKEGISFAEVAKHNIPEPEILAPTEDLEKMKEGISFAEVAKHNIPEPEILAPTEDLEKMKEGVSFADVVAAHKEEEEIVMEVKDEAVLAQTEDLEKMKEGVLFSEVVSHHIEESAVQEEEEAKVDVAAPTEEVLAAEIAAAL